MKKLKKGFTITELVIVIAVIAILAAVLIPTFTYVIKRANRSADEQAVYEMNIILSAYEESDEKPADVGEVIDRLAENGITVSRPLTTDCAFFWCKADNRVVLAEKAGDGYSILFPAQYEGVSIAAPDLLDGDAPYQPFFAADGVIAEGKVTTETTGNGELAIMSIDAQGITHLSIPSEIDGVKVSRLGKVSIGNTGTVTSTPLDIINAEDVEELTISEGIESIAGSSFADLKIERLVFPDSIRFIGAWLFITQDESKNVIENNTLKSVVIGKNVTNYLEYTNSVSGKTKLQGIGQQFAHCTALEEVVVESGIDVLFQESGEPIWNDASSFSPGNAMFEGCTSLSKVTLGDGITGLPDSIFMGCAALKTIIIPNSVRVIGYSAFQNSGLTEITIPASVEYIGKEAFHQNEEASQGSFKYPATNALKTAVFEDLTSGWSCHSISNMSDTPTSCANVSAENLQDTATIASWLSVRDQAKTQYYTMRSWKKSTN